MVTPAGYQHLQLEWVRVHNQVEITSATRLSLSLPGGTPHRRYPAVAIRGYENSTNFF